MEINQKKERKERTLRIGLAEWQVLGYSLTKEEKDRIYGRKSEDSEETEYVGTTPEGVPRVRIEVLLKDVRTGFITPLNFWLQKEVAKAENGKTRYINAVGKTLYANSENELSEWFTKAATYREALVGEGELMEFLRSWLKDIELNLERGGSRNNILLDMSRLFKGDFRELNDLARRECAGTVVAVATVRSKNTPDGMRYYQNVYSKKFLPGYCITYFEDIDKRRPGMVDKFIEDLKGKYGPTELFSLVPLTEYIPGEVSEDNSSPIVGEAPRKAQY